MRDDQLHIFFWCPVCGLHWTNIYQNDDWKRHLSDLGDAHIGELICEHCSNGIEIQPEERDPNVMRIAYIDMVKP